MKITGFLLIALVSVSGLAQGKEHRVLQLGKSFVAAKSDGEIEKLKNKQGVFKKSEVRKFVLRKIKIKKNDTILFENKDLVEHNVFGKGFDYHQKPGAQNKQTFSEPGVRTIRCAIHPKMKLEVIVE